MYAQVDTEEHTTWAGATPCHFSAHSSGMWRSRKPSCSIAVQSYGTPSSPRIVLQMESLWLVLRDCPWFDRVHGDSRSEEHTSELQSLAYLVCRLLLEKKKNNRK